MEVSDEVLDGRGVRAYLLGVGTRQVSDYEADGDSVRMNLSIPEGQRVELKLCYTVDHERDQCSQRRSAIA